MRLSHALWGMLLGLALVSSVNSSVAEDPPRAATIDKDADLAPDSLLPPIPAQLFSRLSSNEAELTALGLSKQQAHDLRTLTNDVYTQARPLGTLRSDLEQAKLSNHRFLLAIAELQEEFDAKGRATLQRTLTFEQRAQVRQKHRQELAQMSAQPLRPVLSPYNMIPIEQALTNDDLLTILLQPDIRQTLLITDEQWLQIEAVKKEAYPAARVLTVALLKTQEIKPIEETPKRPSIVEGLMKNSMDVLTPEQAAKYETLLKERRRKVSLAAEKNDLTEVMRLSVEHGMPAQQQVLQMANGVKSLRAVPYNLFAETDFVDGLDLTPAQQKTLAELVAECDRAIQQAHNEYQAAYFTKGAERQKQLRDLILPHNRQFQARLANLLTSEQNDLLKKAKWRGLGLAALLRPEIVAELQLTDKQKEAIDAQFKIPAPQMKFPAKPGDPDEFRKNSEEFHKKSREHSATVMANVWGQLTPEQVDKFEKLTGLRPAPMRAAPAAPAGN